MTAQSIRIPPGLTRQAGLGDDWVAWLDRLPRLLRDLLEEWELAREGDDVWHGFCSAVLPVRTPTGGRAVLKVSFDGDDEGLHEGLALQHWAGRHTVRLLRADPGRRALLLERLTRRDLTSMPVLDACTVVAETGLAGEAGRDPDRPRRHGAILAAPTAGATSCPSPRGRCRRRGRR